jgi:hypothetical protein
MRAPRRSPTQRMRRRGRPFADISVIPDEDEREILIGPPDDKGARGAMRPRPGA